MGRVPAGHHPAAQATHEPRRHWRSPPLACCAGHGQPEAGLDDRNVGEHVLRPAGVVEAAPVAYRCGAQPGPGDPSLLVEGDPGQRFAARGLRPAKPGSAGGWAESPRGEALAWVALGTGIEKLAD